MAASPSPLAGPQQQARASVLHSDHLEGAGSSGEAHVTALHLIPVASWAASRRSAPVLPFLGTPNLQSLKTWGCNTVKAVRRLAGSLPG